MDVTCAILRMQPACLMQSGIFSENMQQAPSFGGYQSFLNPDILRLCKIGYCPMMEDFGTDLTTVSKVLKNAQMVSDAMEHNNAVITSDVAIFIQAKEIQLKFSEELSNTVVRLGGLHSALNHLSLLGKKFRFYLSALENISVYVLIISNTLSVFNEFQLLNLPRHKAVRNPGCPRNPVRQRSPIPKITRHHHRLE